MSGQIIEISGAYSPPTDIGVILCNTENDPTTITLPNVASSQIDDQGYKLIVQDLSNNASVNSITIQGSNGELINGKASEVLSTNGSAIMLIPFANSYWVAFPIGTGGGGGDSIGLLEIPLTLFQSGSTYYAKMGAINSLLGDASSFVITPQAGANSDLVKSTEKIITEVSIIFYFQCISQGSNRRVFASLFAGARSTGGAFSPAVGQNNFRWALPVSLLYVSANTDIFSRLSWNGVGTLILNGAIMQIKYIQ